MPPPDQPPHSTDPATVARRWAEYLERYDRYLENQAEYLAVYRKANRLQASAQSAQEDGQRRQREGVEKASKRVMILLGVLTAVVLTWTSVKHLLLPALGLDVDTHVDVRRAG